jgi:hypothetical protein
VYSFSMFLLYEFVKIENSRALAQEFVPRLEMPRVPFHDNLNRLPKQNKKRQPLHLRVALVNK